MRACFGLTCSQGRAGPPRRSPCKARASSQRSVLEVREQAAQGETQHGGMDRRSMRACLEEIALFAFGYVSIYRAYACGQSVTNEAG